MKRVHVAAALVTIAGAAALLAVMRILYTWDAWRPATCMPDHCFCESIRAQLIRQPSNSISGLAFLTLGVLVLGATPSGSRFSAKHIYPRLYATASIAIALGTIFYHASLTFVGQTADVLGMYLIATFLVLYNAARWREISSRTAAWSYVLGNVILLGGLVLVPGARRYVFAVLVLAALALELAARRKLHTRANAHLFVAAVGILLAGFFIWTLDITRRVCAPQSWLQGHALWHIAGAVSAWLVYRYYDSDTGVTHR